MIRLLRRQLTYALARRQIIPHLTNEIQDWIEQVAKLPVDETDEEPDVCIIEVRKPPAPA
jgi:CTP synthase (UTP-ammonia lyase)